MSYCWGTTLEDKYIECEIIEGARLMVDQMVEKDRELDKIVALPFNTKEEIKYYKKMEREYNEKWYPNNNKNLTFLKKLSFS